MATSSALATAVRSTPRLFAGQCSKSSGKGTLLGGRAMIRAHSTRASEINADHEPIPENYTLDSIKPPKHWAEPDDGESSLSYCACV
jgi:hypothetical protein